MSRQIIRSLRDGLILRRSTVEDTEALIAFHSDVHRDPGAEGPEEYVAAWVRDLMERLHPSFGVDDFTIVEDTRTGAIVSSMCLISQTWSYDGVQFGVGRPELVGTHADYRRRGLVRNQFDVIHQWSAKRGEMLQAITGIPYFYRQFGYEMGLTLGGSRAGYKRQVPKLEEGQEEACRLRPVSESDLPFIAELYAHGNRRYPVACVRDETLWRYELFGKSEKNVNRWAVSLIETSEGEPMGYLAHSTHLRLRQGRVWVRAYELKQGVSWLAVTPSVVRCLWALGEEWAAQDAEQEMETFSFSLGVEHPAYDVFHGRLPHTSPPYAWFVRVPDLQRFLLHIAPALDQRLAGSPLVGHRGEVQISFYRHGLRLVIDAGRVVRVEPWQPTPEQGGDAAFPDLTFLQLLFGYRSLDELDHAFADCWASSNARAVLQSLFPKRPSNVWPVS